MTFNEKHPEIKKGEMFLTNSTIEDYSHIGWKSKRKGAVAYTVNGEYIDGMFLVFVQTKEYDDGMKALHKGVV